MATPYEMIETFGSIDDATAALAALDVPHPQDAETAVEAAFTALADVAAGTALEPFDAQPLLYGLVNLLHQQARRIERERLRLEEKLKAQVETFDGGEIADTEMLETQRMHEILLPRELAFEAMRDVAARMYAGTFGEPWAPPSGSRKNPNPTAAMIDSRDYLRAVKEAREARCNPVGTRIAVAGGIAFNDVDAAWRALDKARDRVGDMVLIHGGASKGTDLLAAKWAEARGVPQIVFKPDFAQGKKAPFLRNDRIVAERPRAVILFPKAGGVALNLGQKAAQAGVKVWRPIAEPAADKTKGTA